MEPPRIHTISLRNFPRNEGHRPTRVAQQPALFTLSTPFPMRGWRFTADAPSRPAPTNPQKYLREQPRIQEHARAPSPHILLARLTSTHHFGMKFSIFRRVKHQKIKCLVRKLFLCFGPVGSKNPRNFKCPPSSEPNFQDISVSAIFAVRDPKTNSPSSPSGF